MLPFDTGGRKPPLSQTTQQQQPPSSFATYDAAPPTTNPASNMEMAQMNDIAIVQTIPNNESEVNEIACIIISGETGHLRETQSFSVNFSVHNSFEGQADYIRDCLDGRVWIVADDDSQLFIDNSFKRLNRPSPRPSQVIDAAQMFDERGVHRSILSGSVNARIKCNEVYSTLQRLALMDLLSRYNCAPLSGVLSTQAMPMGSANDTFPQHGQHGQHQVDSMTESTQWATTTTDNNYETTFNNDAPKTDYVANNLNTMNTMNNNMNNVAVGTNTSTTLEEEVNYDYHAQPEETHQVQQQPVEEVNYDYHAQPE